MEFVVKPAPTYHTVALRSSVLIFATTQRLRNVETRQASAPNGKLFRSDLWFRTESSSEWSPIPTQQRDRSMIASETTDLKVRLLRRHDRVNLSLSECLCHSMILSRCFRGCHIIFGITDFHDALGSQAGRANRVFGAEFRNNCGPVIATAERPVLHVRSEFGHRGRRGDESGRQSST
jgi:hypothetical protein